MEQNKLSETTEFLLKVILANNITRLTKQEQTKLMALNKSIVNLPVVYVGVTSSSIAAGAYETLAAVHNYISERELDIAVVEVGSNGLCNFEPIMDVQLPGKNRISFKQVTANIVPQVLDGVLNNFPATEIAIGQYRNQLLQAWPGVPFFDEIAFFNQQHRILLANCGLISPNSIDDYMALGGYQAFTKTLSEHTHTDVCNMVEASGLRGRGGGGYPTGVKWKKAFQNAAGQKYFICNADESDPGAFMDRTLIESNPHLIVEGIAISAYAIGASKAIVYTRNRYSIAVQRIENAIKQAYQTGLLGFNILNSGFNLEVTVRKGPGAYVCGEETALIQSLEGKRGTPTLKPPYPTTRGVFNMPTVVNNVETVANIPFIINNGSEWFSSIGTESSKGTKLFSVTGKVNQTCVVEVPMGTQISKVVELAGGVPTGKFLKAVQLGGPSGTCVSTANLNTQIDFDVLKDKELTMGSGGFIVFDDSVCIIDMVKYFMLFIQNESCGKCIPCREGSRRMLEILESITKRPSREEGTGMLERFKGVIQLESLATVMRDTSLCGLGQTASKPLLSAIQEFRNEFEEHIFDRKCTAGVCNNLRTFYIDVEKCTGCNVCAKKCPTNAIIGTPRSPYFIIEEKCIGCGICEDVCKFSAVFFK